MTQADYARHRKARGLPGGTREAVRKAIAEQRITLLPNRRINPMAADRAWAENSLPKLEGLAPGTDPESRAANLRLVSTREGREAVRKQLDELRLMQATGEVVFSAPILSAAIAAARTAQDRFDALAVRLGPVMAMNSDPAECARLMLTEFRKIYAGLRKPVELLSPDPVAGGGLTLEVPPMAPLPPPVARGRFGR